MQWYLSDHLGSTTLLVNESGLEVERTEYFPYGEVQSGGLEKYGFTGQENDADTGLMYYGARYYSPGYRIFVQPDTMLPDPYNPQALNRYAYALNNPLKYTDPSGHVAIIPIIVAAMAVHGYISAIQDTREWNNKQMDTGTWLVNVGVAIISPGRMALGGLNALKFAKNIKNTNPKKIIQTAEAAKASADKLCSITKNEGVYAGANAIKNMAVNDIKNTPIETVGEAVVLEGLFGIPTMAYNYGMKQTDTTTSSGGTSSGGSSSVTSSGTRSSGTRLGDATTAVSKYANNKVTTINTAVVSVSSSASQSWNSFKQKVTSSSTYKSVTSAWSKIKSYF